MKINKKKIVLAAAVFSAACNLNGCGVYGPPPDSDVFDDSYSIQTSGEDDSVVSDGDFSGDDTVHFRRDRIYSGSLRNETVSDLLSVSLNKEAQQ